MRRCSSSSLALSNRVSGFTGPHSCSFDQEGWGRGGHAGRLIIINKRAALFRAPPGAESYLRREAPCPPQPDNLQHLTSQPIFNNKLDHLAHAQLAVRTSTCSNSCSLQPVPHNLSTVSMPNAPTGQSGWDRDRRAAAHKR